MPEHLTGKQMKHCLTVNWLVSRQFTFKLCLLDQVIQIASRQRLKTTKIYLHQNKEFYTNIP
jgi:phosphate-selective porin